MRHLYLLGSLLLALYAPVSAQPTYPAWTTSTTPPIGGLPPAFNDGIRLTSPNSIWVKQFTGIRSTVYNGLLSSTDNGQTWQQSSNSLNSVLNWSALDGLHAWAVGPGNTLYYTSTGAAGFTQVPAQVPNAEAVHFFSASTGIVLSSSAVGATNWSFYRSTDGGNSWQTIPGLPLKAAGESIQFFSSQGTHCWAATTQGHLLRTADAGLTWTQYNIPERFCLISFRDVQHGLGYGTSFGRPLYRTTDGGATWSLVASTGPRYLDLLNVIPGSRGAYLSGAINTGSVGSANGSSNYNACSISYDEGQTWRDLLNPGPNIYSIRSIGASENGDIWIGMHPDILLHYIGTPLANTETHTLPKNAAYPNPCSGELQIPTKGNFRRAQVFDTTGRLCFSASLHATTTSINLSSLANGLYQLRLDGGPNGPQIQRIVLAH